MLPFDAALRCCPSLLPLRLPLDVALAAGACLLVTPAAPCCCLLPLNAESSLFMLLLEVARIFNLNPPPTLLLLPLLLSLRSLRQVFVLPGSCKCCNKSCGSFMLACLPKCIESCCRTALQLVKCYSQQDNTKLGTMSIGCKGMEILC